VYISTVTVLMQARRGNAVFHSACQNNYTVFRGHTIGVHIPARNGISCSTENKAKWIIVS
jgi:hypothetical protein